MVKFCYLMVTKLDFANWLQDKLNRQGWDQAELADRSGLSSAQVSRIISEIRSPGPDACTAIARAFGLPPEIVFRKAGLLPPAPQETTTTRELVYMFLQLDEDAQDRMMQIARAFLEAKKEGVTIGGEKPAST